MRRDALGVLAFAVGCGVSDDISNTHAAEANQIGVATIETTTYGGDTETLELRGLDSSGNEVARYTVRTGTIADRDEGPFGASFVGTELIGWAQGKEIRRVTRERELIRLAPEADPVLEAFVKIPSVAAALEKAHVTYYFVPDVATGEVAYNTQSCPSGYLNASPTAGMCCFSWSPFSYHYGVEPYGGGWTTHINGVRSSGYSTTGVQRNRNPGVFQDDSWTVQPGTPCKARDGGSCSGTGCYYGPNGFSRPIIITAWTWASFVGEENFGWSYCKIFTDSSQWPGIWANSYPDVTGSFGAGQNCPGGNDQTTDWDY